MKLIARALFCLKHPWAESVNDCTLGCYTSQTKEGERNAALHQPTWHS